MDAPPRLALGANGPILDLAAARLVGPGGETVPLRPQAFAVLRMLAERPGEVVTKDEILAAVWPGVAVTDDSLVQAIGDIRRAIGDEARTVLRTAPRQGYRLVPPDRSGRRPRRAPLAAAAALCVLGALAAGWSLRPRAAPDAAPLVAVLPFESLADDAATRRLAGGLTEDLVTDLARFAEFEVLSSDATEVWRGRAADPGAIARDLGADFVVEGAVARASDRLRVTAALIDAPAGRRLWADRWDRPLADLFAIQSEIAETIANRLGGGAGLVQESGRIAARRKPPANLGAYDLYLLGTERLERVTRPDLEAALDLLTRSVELDAGFARAWIELYHTHELLAHLGVEPERNRALADAAAERAIALDPGDPEAHAVYGASLGMRGDFVRAEAEFETALRLAPNAAEILIFYIGWASSFGKPERGADLVARAIRLDPNYPSWANRPFAAAHFMAGRYAEAVTFFELLGAQRHNRWSWAAHAGALAAAGRTEEARALVAAALDAFPELSIELILNEPGWTEAERARFVETMRLAGFPPCAREAGARDDETFRRLPECAPGQAAGTNRLDAKRGP